MWPSQPACPASGSSELLTVQPALAATGASSLLIEPPALNSAMSTPLKLQHRNHAAAFSMCSSLCSHRGSHSVQRTVHRLFLQATLYCMYDISDNASASPVLCKLLDGVMAAIKLHLLASGPAGPEAACLLPYDVASAITEHQLCITQHTWQRPAF